MPEDELLQMKQSPPKGNVLPDLHRSHPLVRIALGSATRLTHVFFLNVFNNVNLLKDCSIQDFFLNPQLDLDPLRVRFSPNKFSMNQS